MYLVACLLLVAIPLEAVAQATYTTKFDNINVDQILNNDRLLNNYHSCLVGRGRCTADGEELKRIIPDALVSACSKCSPRQREGAEKVLRFLVDRKPHLFTELERKYDPTGYYLARYRTEGARRGIRV